MKAHVRAAEQSARRRKPLTEQQVLNLMGGGTLPDPHAESVRKADEAKALRDLRRYLNAA